MKFIITILMTPGFSLATMAQTTTITLTDGERLEREWWNQFQNPNINVLEKMIAPGFQSVNSLGENDRARMISTQRQRQSGCRTRAAQVPAIAGGHRGHQGARPGSACGSEGAVTA